MKKPFVANIFKSKKEFPYHYEYNLLGGYETVEGLRYFRKYSYELEVENKKALDVYINRSEFFGGAKKIHFDLND